MPFGSCSGHEYSPIVLDNLVYAHRRIVEEVLQVPLVEGQRVQAVLHFAAYAYVGESVQDPARYYRNNLGDSLALLEALVEPVRAGTGPAIPIVLSSTCATYGIPDPVPISEDTPQRPINPYGRSN